MACDPGWRVFYLAFCGASPGCGGGSRGVPGGVRGSAEPVADVGGLLCSHLMREFRVLLAAGSATVRERAAGACAGGMRHCGTDIRVYRRRGALDASICCLMRRRIVGTRARRVAGAAREEEPDEDNPGDAARLCAGIVPAPGRVTVTGGSTGQVSGHAVLVAGVALLRPEEQVLEAMLAGWPASRLPAAWAARPSAAGGDGCGPSPITRGARRGCGRRSCSRSGALTCARFIMWRPRRCAGRRGRSGCSVST